MRMLKVRKKSISLIVVLTFLMTLFPLALPAFAASEYFDISASYNYVDVDEPNNDDGETWNAGEVTIAQGDDWDGSSVANAVYYFAEIELNDGVEIVDGDVDVKIGGTGGTDVDPSKVSISKYTVTIELDAADVVSTNGSRSLSDITVAYNKVDIPSKAEGNLTADVSVWGTDEAGKVLGENDATVTIAKVASGDVAIEVEDPETLTVGSNKEGALITIKELSPGAFSTADPDEIYFNIRNSDVEWDMSEGTNVGAAGLKASISDVDDSTLTVQIDEATTATKGRIELTPIFRVLPGAEGDVEIKISGDGVDTTTVLVGKIGEGQVAIEVEDAEDEVIYRGQFAELEDVEVNLDPSVSLKKDDYITVTLPDGFEWPEYPDSDNANAVVPFNISGYTEGTDYDVDVYNDNQSVWISILREMDKDFDLEDFKIVADADAALGDVELEFGGDAGGTAVIAQCKDAFTITCDPVNVPLTGSDVAINDIIIVEADDEALWRTDEKIEELEIEDEDLYFDIELPMGVSFAKVPDVEVEDGNLKITAKSVKLEEDDDSVLRFEIEKQSGIASTIEITDIELDIDNRAAVGDIVAKVGKRYNVASSKALAEVVIARIVGEDSGRVASFTLVVQPPLFLTVKNRPWT